MAWKEILHATKRDFFFSHWDWFGYLYYKVPSLQTAEANVKSQIWHHSSWEPASHTVAGCLHWSSSINEGLVIYPHCGIVFSVYSAFGITMHGNGEYIFNQWLIYDAFFPMARRHRLENQGVEMRVPPFTNTPYNSPVPIKEMFPTGNTTLNPWTWN